MSLCPFPARQGLASSSVHTGSLLSPHTAPPGLVSCLGAGGYREGLLSARFRLHPHTGSRSRPNPRARAQFQACPTGLKKQSPVPVYPSAPSISGSLVTRGSGLCQAEPLPGDAGTPAQMPSPLKQGTALFRGNQGQRRPAEPGWGQAEVGQQPMVLLLPRRAESQGSSRAPPRGNGSRQARGPNPDTGPQSSGCLLREDAADVTPLLWTLLRATTKAPGP